jgi:hypothetical protein
VFNHRVEVACFEEVIVLIRSSLFSRGHPLKPEPGLGEVLENHKRKVINHIRGISDRDQMTPPLLEKLIKDSVVEPLSIHFDKMTHTKRTETLRGDDLRASIPFNSMAGRRLMSGWSDESEYEELGQSKQVYRVSIPFSGDPILLKYSPSTCGLTFPQGEVSDHSIEFDVLLWGGSPEDQQKAKTEVRGNLELIRTYADRINQQVKEFNESLAGPLKAAFDAKLTELGNQQSIFDDLGIPEAPEPVAVAADAATTPTPARRSKGRSPQITIQMIGTLITDQLNQINYNAGDVNNAIQSGE